ncbi:hypothetical protein C6401_13740 [Arthrobacter woluwensis]|nr:hypothetical protein C6401_13740 [Arthrobacter woluwensis]
MREWFEAAKAVGADYLAIADEQYDYITREYSPINITVAKDLKEGQQISRDVFDVVGTNLHSLWDLNQSFDEQFQQSKGSPWSIPEAEARQLELEEQAEMAEFRALHTDPEYLATLDAHEAFQERLQEQQLDMASAMNEADGIAQHERAATPSTLYSDPINHEQTLRAWYNDAVAAGAVYLAVTVDRGDPGVYEFSPARIMLEDEQRILDADGNPNVLFDVVGKNPYSLWDLREPFEVQFQQQNGRPWNLHTGAELTPGWEMHWDESLGLSKAQQETLLAHVEDHAQFLRDDLARTNEEAEREARPYDVLAAQLEASEFLSLTKETGALLQESFAVHGWGNDSRQEPQHMQHLVKGIWTAQERPTESQVPADSDGWGDPIPVEQLEEKTTFVDPEVFHATKLTRLRQPPRARAVASPSAEVPPSVLEVEVRGYELD